MIDWITIIITGILTYTFSLFPSISFDLSAPVGSVLLYINTFHSIFPNFFDMFFRTFWIGNMLAYIAILNIILLRFIPAYKN